MWQALERVGIQEEVSKLSEGLRSLLVDPLTGRRFLSEDVLLLASIARALLTNSLGILLDEPLRRSGRQDVWEVIKMMAREKIIILSVDSEEDLKGLDLSGVRINKVRLNAEIKREERGAGARTAETFLN